MTFLFLVYRITFEKNGVILSPFIGSIFEILNILFSWFVSFSGLVFQDKIQEATGLALEPAVGVCPERMNVVDAV